MLHASTALAQTTYFYSSGANTNWTTTSGSWSTSGTGPFTSNWVDGNAASLVGTGRTLTISSGAITLVNTLTSTASNFTIAATSTNRLLLSGASFLINNGTRNLTITAPLSTDVGSVLTLSGTTTAGGLTFSGSNAVRGAVVVTGANRIVYDHDNAFAGTTGISMSGSSQLFLNNKNVTGVNVSLSGTGQSTGGNLSVNTGNSSWAGGIDLTGAANTMTVRTSGSFRMTGVITGGTGNSLVLNNVISASNGGTIRLSGANTFQGPLSLLGGTLVVGANATTGVAGALGVGTTPLQVGDATTSGTAALRVLADGGFTVGRDIAVFNSGSTTTLGGSHTTETSTFAGSIALQKSIFLQSLARVEVTGAMSGGAGITKTGTGVASLSGSNTYTGQTAVAAGRLEASSIGSIGAGASSLGAPTTAANGTILIGSSTVAAGLTYRGTGDVTDRVLDLAGTTGGATLDQSGSGLLKFTSDLTASGSGAKTLVLQGSTSGTGELAGAIVDYSGAGGPLATAVTKAGTGAWTLSGLNTYTGITTINGGTLSVATLTNGETSGGLGAASASAANLVLGGGALSYTGTSVSIDRSFTLTASTTSTIDVANADTTLTFSGSSAVTTGALSKAGPGTLVLTGAQSYTGATAILGGVLQVGGGATAGTLGGSGAVVNQGTLVFNRSDNYGGAFTRAISGSGGVSLLSGSLTLAAANSYTGDTSIAGGNLILGDAAAVSASTVDAGGSLSFGTLMSATFGGLKGSSDIALTNVAGTPAAVALTVGGNNQSTAYGGTLSGLGSLVKTGTETLTLSTAQTYAGSTTVGNGTLRLTGSGALPVSGTVSLTSAGATLDLSGVSSGTTTFGLLSGSSGAVVSLGSKTLTVGNASSSTFAGGFTGSGRLFKVGAGTLNLNGASSHSGGLQIGSGTLPGGTVTIGDPAALGSGTATVSNGTLQFNVSTGSATGLPTVNLATAASAVVKLAPGVTVNNPILAPGGNANNIGGLTAAGTATLGGTITWPSGQQLRIDSGNAAGVLVIAGGITGGDAAQQILFNRFSAGVVAMATPASYIGGGSWTNGSAPVGTVIYSGAVRLATSQALNQSAILHFNLLANARLELAGVAQTVQSAYSTTKLSDRRGVITNPTPNTTGTLTFNTVANNITPLANSLGGFQYLTASVQDTGSGLMSIVKNGTATMTFVNTGSYSGGTVVNAGTLTGFQGSAFGSGSVTVNGGTFLVDFNAFASGSGSQQITDSVAGGVVFRGGGMTVRGRPNGPTIASVAATTTVAGGVTPSDGRLVTLTSGSTAGLAVGQVVSGSSIVAGNFIAAIVSNTQFLLDASNTASSAGPLSLAATTNQSSQSYGSATFDADATITVSRNDGDGTTLTFGSVSGTGRLTKAGDGDLVVNGANGGFSGGTTISAGRLFAGSATALGTAGVSLAGGELDLGGFAMTNAITNAGGSLLNAASYAGTQTVTALTSLTGTVGGTVNVASGGVLKGSGSQFTGPVTIVAGGVHSPGNSPGIQSFSSGLTYAEGSALQWELVANTDAGRGVSYDGIDVTGGDLSIAATGSGALLSLVFNGAGSTVDWTDPFWDTARTWTIIDFTSSGLSAGVFALSGSPSTWLDLNGAALQSVRSGGTFQVSSSGVDSVLTYVIVVPEPSALAAAAGLTLVVAACLRRRRDVPRRGSP